MRASEKSSVTYKQSSATWHLRWWEDGHRRSRRLGSNRELPTRDDAERKAAALLRKLQRDTHVVPLVKELVEDYRREKMPQLSTKRGYDSWLQNHIVPQWGHLPLTAVQARPVELWLRQLNLRPKSKAHIRGLLAILWDYAMWRGAVPLERNPMELVTIKGATRRTRHAVSLSPEQFQALLQAVGEDLLWRTLMLTLVGFGLRISEALGLKWGDIDWLEKTLRIERGVIKQVVGEVKTEQSRKPQAISEELLEVLTVWKQASKFSEADDWLFASPYKGGSQPLSYTFVWETLDAASKKVGIGHISSHCFRHTYRTWLDSFGTPVGVQQRLMRHADIRTTMNTYGDAINEDMRKANEKVARTALFSVDAGGRPKV